MSVPVNDIIGLTNEVGPGSILTIVLILGGFFGIRSAITSIQASNAEAAEKKADRLDADNVELRKVLAGRPDLSEITRRMDASNKTTHEQLADVADKQAQTQELHRKQLRALDEILVTLKRDRS